MDIGQSLVISSETEPRVLGTFHPVHVFRIDGETFQMPYFIDVVDLWSGSVSTNTLQ